MSSPLNRLTLQRRVDLTDLLGCGNRHLATPHLQCHRLRSMNPPTKRTPRPATLEQNPQEPPCLVSRDELTPGAIIRSDGENPLCEVSAHSTGRLAVPEPVTQPRRLTSQALDRATGAASKLGDLIASDPL